MWVNYDSLINSESLGNAENLSEIEPLHLLAAILAEESSQGSRLLQGAGITQEKVLLSLSGPAGN
jgi:hypothetical protein